jgi:hypothetical protein
MFITVVTFTHLLTHLITVLHNKHVCHNALCNVATLHLLVPYFPLILRSIRGLIQFSM